MLTRQQKRTLLTITKFIVPAIFVFILVMATLNAYTIYSITHPTRTKYAAGPDDYKLTGHQFTKKDESWNLKGGGQGSGWFLPGASGAPGIVLSHSYGQNMVDLLSLAVALHDAGYHVLIYDLRGHGENKIDYTSLGDAEAEDLSAAIEHMKSLTDTDGSPLVDKERIGLYGVSLGGYASLVAAGKDRAVKAVVVDAVYPDVNRYLQIKIKDFSSMNNRFMSYFADIAMKIYFPGKYGSTSASKSVRNYAEVKQLYILGKDTGDLQLSTGEVYNQALAPKETVEVPHSRLNILYRNDQDVYDPVVVDFFRRADVLPPLPAQTPALKAEVQPDKK